MKKLALTIAIVLFVTLSTFAGPNGGGLFQRGTTSDEYYSGAGNRENNSFLMPGLPLHDEDESQDGTPLGSGIAVLLGLSATYLVRKRQKNE